MKIIKTLKYTIIILMILTSNNLEGQVSQSDSILYLVDSIFKTPDIVIKNMRNKYSNFDSEYTLVVRDFDKDTLCIPQNNKYDFSFYNLEKGDSIWLFFPKGIEKDYFTYSNNISYTNRVEKIQKENRYIDVNFNFEEDSFFSPVDCNVKLDNGDGTLWKVAFYRFVTTLSVDDTTNLIETSLESHKDINVSPNTFQQLKFLYIILPNEYQKAFGRKKTIRLLTDPEKLKHSLNGRSF